MVVWRGSGEGYANGAWRARPAACGLCARAAHSVHEPAVRAGLVPPPRPAGFSSRPVSRRRRRRGLAPPPCATWPHLRLRRHSSPAASKLLTFWGCFLAAAAASSCGAGASRFSSRLRFRAAGPTSGELAVATTGIFASGELAGQAQSACSGARLPPGALRQAARHWDGQEQCAQAQREGVGTRIVAFTAPFPCCTPTACSRLAAPSVIQLRAFAVNRLRTRPDTHRKASPPLRPLLPQKLPAPEHPRHQPAPRKHICSAPCASSSCKALDMRQLRQQAAGQPGEARGRSVPRAGAVAHQRTLTKSANAPPPLPVACRLAGAPPLQRRQHWRRQQQQRGDALVAASEPQQRSGYKVRLGVVWHVLGLVAEIQQLLVGCRHRRRRRHVSPTLPERLHGGLWQPTSLGVHCSWPLPLANCEPACIAAAAARSAPGPRFIRAPPALVRPSPARPRQRAPASLPGPRLRPPMPP